jgi:riboflavin kinase / FMN adenylyltransferase
VKIHHGLPESRLGRAALTIGSFDGLHLAHQAVIRQLTELAADRGLTRALITFEPHPRCVLDPDHCPKNITTLDEKLRLLEELGVEDAIVLLFNRELAGLAAADFMARLLSAMDLRLLVTGHDFALGRGREGDLAWLRDFCGEHDIAVQALDPLLVNGQELHSSEIRRLVTLGDVDQANRLLGRDYSLQGVVEHGHQVGRDLGFPTLNISVAPNKLVPGPGVYAGRARVGGELFKSAIGVGYRPTFGGTDLTVEAYLLDFDRDLYQQRVEVTFAARLRDEVKFATPEALAEQMRRDVDETRRVLDA